MKRHFFSAIFVVAFLFGASAAFGQTASVAGEWEGTFNTPGGSRPFKVVFNVDGEKLTGTAKRPSGDVPLTGAIKGDKINFSYTITYGENALTLMFDGTVTGDAMGGNLSFGGNAEDSWTAKRVVK